MCWVTSNDPKKPTWQMHHAYEQEFRDIRGLPAQNNFSLICVYKGKLQGKKSTK